jgi:hypothetical protein
MMEFPQTMGNLTDASSNLYETIKAQGIIAYPDDAIRLAMQRAVAIEGSRGWKISKDKASHKIDVLIALGMAALATVKESSAGSAGEAGYFIRDHAGRLTRPSEDRPSALSNRLEFAKNRRNEPIRFKSAQSSRGHCEQAPTRSGLRDILLPSKCLILGMGGDLGGLVSQKREKPNARSQESFDRNEGDNARWSGAAQ